LDVVTGKVPNVCKEDGRKVRDKVKGERVDGMIGSGVGRVKGDAMVEE
jgi:hypothetical protein